MTNEKIIETDWDGISSLNDIPKQDKKLLLAVMVSIMENLNNDGVQHHFTYFTYVSRNGYNVILKLLSSVLDKLIYACSIDSVYVFYFCPNIPIIFTELNSINDRKSNQI